MTNDQSGAKPDSYADRRDLRFGEAGKEKEEAVDDALRSGAPVPDDEGQTPRRQEDPSKGEG